MGLLQACPLSLVSSLAGEAPPDEWGLARGGTPAPAASRRPSALGDTLSPPMRDTELRSGVDQVLYPLPRTVEDGAN
jgi:hypothetical protein